MFKKKYRIPFNLPVEFSSYEKVISIFLGVIIPLLVLSDSYVEYFAKQNMINYRKIFLQSALYITLITAGLYKLSQIKRNNLKPGQLCRILKLIDILLVSLILSTLKYGLLFCFIVFVPIVSICITEGFWASMWYVFYATVIQFFSALLVPIIIDAEITLINSLNFSRELFIITLYLVFIVLLRILDMHNDLYTLRELDNQKHLSELKKEYDQLMQARNERQEQFEKLKEVNSQLEEMNRKLTSSLAEFFTLQQISQAISSIFDMNELLKFVNDIILGVMGVATSNIALYNKEGNRLKVQVTNISNARERALLTDNINSPALKECLDKGMTIIDNSVDTNKYSFTKGRNVKSLMCVPLQVKGNTYGLILIEHTITNAFDENSVRLLEVITQQVSIAIENAKLYEKLQDYANTDGLTQVYNRAYFQKRLYEELSRARQQDYEVSIIFFDIDDFKIYNDTYGHLFGDMILQSIALAVKDSVRKDDVVARFGGEEFIILLPYTGKEVAYEKAEELRRKISELVICDQNNNVASSVSVSMGVSTFPTLAKNEIELLNSADKALYAAKERGKNCVSLAQPCTS